MIKKLITTAILSSVIGSAFANPELGYMTVKSGSNGFINATINLDAMPEELANKSLKVKLGSITDFYRHDIEYDQHVSSLRFSLDKDTNGKPLIRVRSIREISTNQLQAVVKLHVGRQKIYGVYDLQATSTNNVALNLLNSDYKPEPKLLVAKAHPPKSKKISKPASIAIKKLPEKELAAITEVVSEGQYQVMPGKTLSQIAMELYPQYPQADGWKGLMGQIFNANPDAFIDADINKLRADAVLDLPQPTIANSNIEKAPAAKPAMRPSLINEPNDQYLVAKGETISAIAMALTERYPQAGSWQAISNQLVASNPDAFIDGDPNKLLANATLTLPDASEISFENSTVDAKAIMTSPQGNSEINQAMLRMTRPVPTEKNMTTPEEGYAVSKGESISFIAQKLSSNYSDSTDWKNVMASLIELNPDAFIDNDLNKLRSDAILVIPEEKDIAIEAENQELPQSSIPDISLKKPAPTVSETYRVVKGDSLSVIAFKLLSEYQRFDNWYALMQELVKLNPSVFKDNDIGVIPVGTVLKLPASDSKEQEKASTSSEGHYIVTGDYSISMIAIQLIDDFPQYQHWTELMQDLYQLNPQAFANSDINQLQSKARLKLPVRHQV